MKYRRGFVSNSSSSSFILDVDAKDPAESVREALHWCILNKLEVENKKVYVEIFQGDSYGSSIRSSLEADKNIKVITEKNDALSRDEIYKYITPQSIDFIKS